VTSPNSFMTDPDQMRTMAGKFDAHANFIQAESRKMVAMTEAIQGASWHGTAYGAHYDTVGQMNQAFTNIVNMLSGVRDGLVSNANTYEDAEHQAQQSLRS
jgi:WXG100 family type VII secretion target